MGIKVALVWAAELFSDIACVAKEVALKGIASLPSKQEGILEHSKQSRRALPKWLSLGALLKWNLLLAGLGLGCRLAVGRLKSPA